jgi:hypothetical protein
MAGFFSARSLVPLRDAPADFVIPHAYNASSWSHRGAENEEESEWMCVRQSRSRQASRSK